MRYLKKMMSNFMKRRKLKKILNELEEDLVIKKKDLSKKSYQSYERVSKDLGTKILKLLVGKNDQKISTQRRS